MIVLIWLGLFVATALTDWLSAKWVDAWTDLRRAHISAIHEAVGMIAGFTVYNWTHSVWTIVPCVLGAWTGSYLAGEFEREVDPQFLQAVSDAVELVLNRDL